MPNPTLTAAIDTVASRRDLSREQARDVLVQIMRGEASEIEISALLIGLRTKGETEDEIAGLAEAMRHFAKRVTSVRSDLVDTAGTGGGRTTINVSTTAALVAAGAGCAVAKHGNRSATARSGSADVLEALGARIDLDAAAIGTCIDAVGFGFMFAPYHHAATGYVVPVRKGLAVRTIFNLLGPLTNPADARRQLIGVSDRAFVEPLAGAIARLGCERALVVSSADGLDELSTCAPTTVAEVGADREIRIYEVTAADVGLPPGPAAVGGGGTPEQNAAVARAILSGQQSPVADLVLLNAGAAIYAAGIAADLREGVERGRAAIASGAATASLEAFVEKTHELAPVA